MFAYQEVSKEKIQLHFDDYIASLSGVYDDYLEYHILKAVFYEVTFQQESIGYFAVYDKNMLTQFFIQKEWLHLAQGAFKTVLEQLHIQYAYVPTVDELFLSLSMDFHKQVHLQAYFFQETEREVPPATYPKSMLRLAGLSDAETIKALSGDFFDELYQMISDRKIYILEEGEIYGFGIVESNLIHTNYKGIGMFTVEKHRQKGVGRSIILHLKDLVHTLGFKPLPGCWYHNYNSKRTLESCGFTSKTRLLKVEF